VLQAMSFRDLVPEARSLVAARRCQLCARCSAEADHVLRKSAALPWAFWCPVHGARFQGLGGRSLQSVGRQQLWRALTGQPVRALLGCSYGLWAWIVASLPFRT